jgi:hypothetical protein
VLGALKDLLLGNEELVNEFTAEFKRELIRLRRQRNGDSRRLSRDLEQVEHGIKRCLEFITGGDGHPGSVREKLRELEERGKEINEELRTQMRDPDTEIHPNLRSSIVGRSLTCSRCRETRTPAQGRLTSSDPFSTASTYILDPRVADARSVVGALAQILAFAHQDSVGSSSSARSGKFLMVAGATTWRGGCG